MSLVVVGIPSTAARLRAIADRVEHLEPVWPVVGGVIASSMAAQFASAGAAGGKPWAPLSPPYYAWKASHGFGTQTLVRTGELMHSLTSRPMSIERYTGSSASFGSRVPYFKFHQRGTSKMPQREVLFAFEPMVTRVQRKVVAYVMDGVTG